MGKLLYGRLPFFEAQWLEVLEKEIQLKTFTQSQYPGTSLWPSPSEVSLKYLENALKLGLDQSPDLCIITEFHHRSARAEKILEYGNLGHFAAKVHFACLGNHDGGCRAWGFLLMPSRLLRSAKIKLLLNEKYEVFIKGQRSISWAR